MTIGLSTGSFTRIGPGLYEVSFDVGLEETRFAGGLEKLVFEFFYILLTRKGSIPRSPNTGTGFRDLIGRLAMGATEKSHIELAITNEVLDAESQVINGQVNARLPADEMLASVEIPSITIEAARQRVLVSLRVINTLGHTVDFQIPLGATP